MISLNTKEFETALKGWIEGTSIDAAWGVNFAMKQTIIKANAHTKTETASKGKIQSEMDEVVAAKDGRTAPRKILLAQRGKKGKRSGTRRQQLSQIRKDVTKKVNARKRGSGYLPRALWKAGQDFGLFKKARFGKGWARESKGKPATKRQFNPTAYIPKGTESKVKLDDAVKAATQVFLTKTQQRMARRAKKHSAR